MQTELIPEQQAGWRRQGEQLLGLLDDQQTGLVITLDEIHGADRDELAQLAASVQHFIRAGLPVALVFAGVAEMTGQDKPYDPEALNADSDASCPGHSKPDRHT